MRQRQTLAPYREHELLVRFRAGTSEFVKETIFTAQGARRKKQLRGESGIEKLELGVALDIRTAALELLLNPQVEFAEPNFLISKEDLTPNDPQFNAQWGLRNTGQNGGQYGQMSMPLRLGKPRQVPRRRSSLSSIAESTLLIPI